MDRVVIGMDPHKASVTIEARDGREVLRARGRFGTTGVATGSCCGSGGSGRSACGRWRARTGSVVRSPSAAGRRGASAGRAGQAGRPGPGVRHRPGRKTDAADAHAIVMVALRDEGLRELTVDPRLEALRLLLTAATS
jgi:transposase